MQGLLQQIQPNKEKSYSNKKNFPLILVIIILWTKFGNLNPNKLNAIFMFIKNMLEKIFQKKLFGLEIK
jgi:hypothetical protein